LSIKINTTKYLRIHDLRIVEKILCLLVYSISVNATKLKCRISLAVTGLRPPPGGPIAQQKFTSTNFLKSPEHTHKKKFLTLKMLKIWKCFEWWL